MFGHNQIIGQKFFRDAPEARAGKLLVTSIFHTLQGEGPFAGQPAIFLRLAHCNLDCSFCDTYFDRGDWMTPQEIIDRAAACAVPGAAPPDLLVVTGGEPLLQADALGGLLRRAYGDLGCPLDRYQLESNGTVKLGGPLIDHQGVGGALTLVVSPKVSEKTGQYLKPHSETIARARCLKFVVSGDPASPYHLLPDWASDFMREIYVSPMAVYRHAPDATRRLYDERSAPDLADRTSAERISFWDEGLLDKDACRRNYEYAAEVAIKRGLRLSLQMHLFASLP